jgi:hypothetical protein
MRRVSSRRPLRLISLTVAMLAITLSLTGAGSAQTNKNQPQSGLSNIQRFDIMRSKLEAMRRSLDSAIAGINAKDSGGKEKNPDDPRERLRGLEKEVGSVLSEVNDLRTK